MFWSNHFVIEFRDINQPAYLYQYYALLQTHALGNFKTFISEVGLAPAMLRYLNGFENKKNSPNENYARELYELFSLGEGNGYTQEDITETARALTGYNRSKTNGGIIEFNEKTYDKGSKTIFGQTGNWGYDDVINILFQEKKTLLQISSAPKFIAILLVLKLISLSLPIWLRHLKTINLSFYL